jgi:hypothetical protein
MAACRMVSDELISFTYPIFYSEAVPGEHVFSPLLPLVAGGQHNEARMSREVDGAIRHTGNNYFHDGRCHFCSDHHSGTAERFRTMTS